MAHRRGEDRGMGGKKHFQIKLGGEWRDYSSEEERCLILAYSSGRDKARFTLRGQHYDYDFKRMEQVNVGSGRRREIRPPPGWRPPAKVAVPKGPTMLIMIPDRSPMPRALKVPHPQAPHQVIVVKVPKGARPGREMLIPVPPVLAEAADAPAAPPALEAAGAGKSGGTGGGRVAAGVAGVAAAGGAVVVGAIVAETIESGAAADVVGEMGDDIADLAEDVGEAVIDAAEDATEWLVGAEDDAGGLIMDLF